MLMSTDNNKRHLTILKVNDFRDKYFKAVNSKSPFFKVGSKLVITKFAKFYLMELESKFKTLN
jgi:hypothetical protein